MANPVEVRATSSSGGQKGRKLARFALIPWDAIWMVAEVFGKGAEKYEDRNWEKGYSWSWSVDAMMRHFTAFWEGKDYDTINGAEDGECGVGQTGLPHIAQFAWHALVLVAFWLRDIGDDDRPVRGIKQ